MAGINGWVKVTIWIFKQNLYFTQSEINRASLDLQNSSVKLMDSPEISCQDR